MLKKDSFVPGRHGALRPAILILLFACFLTGCGGPSTGPPKPAYLSDYWTSKGEEKIRSHSGRPNASLYIRYIHDDAHGPSGALTLLIDDKSVDYKYWFEYIWRTSDVNPLILKTGTHNIMLQVHFYGDDIFRSLTMPIGKLPVDLKEDEVWLLLIRASYLKDTVKVWCKKIGDRGKFTYHPDAKYNEVPQLNKYLKDIVKFESTNTLKYESTKKKGQP